MAENHHAFFPGRPAAALICHHFSSFEALKQTKSQGHYFIAAIFEKTKQKKAQDLLYVLSSDKKNPQPT